MEATPIRCYHLDSYCVSPRLSVAPARPTPDGHRNRGANTMKCPNCADSELRAVLTTQGIEIDRCDACEGVWLDRGEIFLFAGKAKPIAAKLERALATRTPTGKRSPASGAPMDEIAYPGGPRIDYCPSSGRLWFDAGELAALLGAEPGIRMTVDPKSVDRNIGRSRIPEAGGAPGEAATDDREARRHAAIAAGALGLPNLFLRSTVTLAGLYALLGAVMIAAVEFAGADLTIAVWATAGIVVLQFLIGPFMMDLSLRWLYRMRWVTPDEMPGHLRRFVEGVCAEKRIGFPRFAILDDGAPQAFTYGHTPNNARIVLSRGILELLEPAEAEAVAAHEIGHAVHWDMFLMTVAQLVPLIFYYTGEPMNGLA